MKPKLAAIYNCFADSQELFPYSLNCLVGRVDEIVIIYQDKSNFGEEIPFEKLSEKITNLFSDTIFTYVRYEPKLSLGGTYNETAKRNLGLEVAKQSGCTHFVMLDQDELWEDFGKAKKEYFESGCDGSVARMFTYFKKPTFRFRDYDNYFVPFIFELKENSTVGNFRLECDRNYLVCDPTRKLNNVKNCHIIEEPMHHFSWVRKDILMKIRNSSAQVNVANSKRFKDYMNPECGPGYYVEDYKQKLIEVKNIFNIQI